MIVSFKEFVNDSKITDYFFLPRERSYVGLMTILLRYNSVRILF